MTVVLAGRKAARNDVAPELPDQRHAEQLDRHRIGFAHHAMPVDDDHAAGQQIHEALQAPGQALLLVQLLQALQAGLGQLPRQLDNSTFQHIARIAGPPLLGLESPELALESEHDFRFAEAGGIHG